MSNRIDTIVGNYRLTDLLGKGGFAEVYKAQHIHLNKPAVAVKLLIPNNQLTEENLQKFRQEAQIIVDLKHPHIVNIQDFGVDSNTNTPFLVMDYALEGTLRNRHPRGVVVPLTTIVSYLKQISQALSYAHEKRIIHRDVKPANMLIGQDQYILLSDFGIAVPAHRTESQVVQEGSGTAAYMAPEQIKGEPRLASDQYSLGVVTYEWLCGVLPFEGFGQLVAHQHLFVLPPPPSAKNPLLTSAIDEVILKALAKDPHERFDTVEAFSIAFEQAVAIQETTYLASLSTQSDGMNSTVQNNAQSPLPGTTLNTYSNTDNVPLTTVAWSPNGEFLAAGSQDGIITIWNMSMGQSVRYRGHARVTSLSWSPNDHLLASSGTEGTVQVWDISSPRKIHTYRGHSGSVDVVRWSHKGEFLVSGSKDKTVIIWNVSSEKKVHTYQYHKAEIAALSWSPNDQLIASGGHDGSVQIWTSSNGIEVYTNYYNSDSVFDVAWSPDGKYIASLSSSMPVQVWGYNDGINYGKYDTKSSRSYSHSYLQSLAWSPDGKYIAAGGYPHAVYVWKVGEDECVTKYEEGNGDVLSISWSPDGKRIASVNREGLLREWQAL
jgi:WD40 repeat protein/tRNA A-37 threonylcarbamoyl transferase component Bud32